MTLIELPPPADRPYWVLGDRPGVARRWPHMVLVETGETPPGWAVYWTCEGAKTWVRIPQD